MLRVSAGLLLGFQPTGSILSGISSDILGRKKCMLLVGIPQFIAWILMYTANSIPPLYAAAAMMGFTIGFMEAPTLSYIGEICEPEFRSTLASVTSLQVSIGHFLGLLGTVIPWRTTAAISSAVPLVTIIAILQVILQFTNHIQYRILQQQKTIRNSLLLYWFVHYFE